MQMVANDKLAANLTMLDDVSTSITLPRSLTPEEHFNLTNGVLAPEGVALFVRDGFIAIDNLIGSDDIDQMRNTLMRLHQNNVGFAEGANFDAAGHDNDGGTERRFPQILNPHTYAPELINNRYFEVALGIAKQLIGEKARFKLDISFMKPPRIGSDTAWHQDEAFANPAYDHKDITIWLALTPASGENSCMSYIPGSNTMDILPHQPLGGDPRIHALECISGFDPSEAVEVPLRPGCVSIHACRTLHYAGPNRSDNYRLAYALLFDVPPTPRKVPHIFPWREMQHTDRAERQKRFRRRGGIIIHVWRERSRIAPWSVLRLKQIISRFWN